MILWQVLFYGSDGQSKSSFHQFSGVDEEFKAFINDISQANLRVISDVNRHAIYVIGF